ncbi:hypothetical protein LOC51_29470 [Rubrivivax sp. JA1024]|nr:hypothetical protein [Rubrivivax sp. JA1024]
MRQATLHGFRMGALIVLAGAALALAGCDEVARGPQGEPGPQGPAGPAGPPGPAGKDGASASSIRTLSSTSCSANGCPTACDAGETLVSALCIGNGSARFSDNIYVENGIMTARCGASSVRIDVSCARK